MKTQDTQHQGTSKNESLSKKEIKIGENIKTMLAIVFLLALMGAALDLIV